MDDFLLNNPLLKGMDQEKLQFIMNFAAKDKPTNMSDAMPFLLANMNQAKKQNIRFSNPEIQLIAEILSKDLPPAEKTKINKIMSMMLK
ncbi:MAG: hypothetical protein IJA07_02415 [Agathobacter sp.]|nr:hypothetical protein [Agathobacter sp.]